MLDNESTGNRSAVDFERVTFVHGDIRDRSDLRACLKGVSSVVNLAADTTVIESVEDPEFNFDVNVVGTFYLLAEAKALGIEKIVHASTGGAIIGSATPPVHENMAASPMSPYGASKLANEGYMSAFAGAYGMHTVSLRFSNVYGPGSFHKGSVVAQFYKQILRGETLNVYGDGTQQRDFLFIEDLTDGIARALNSSVTGVFQLGSGYPTSINQLIDDMRIVVGSDHPFGVQYCEQRAGEVHQTWCNIDKARHELGFSPDTSLQDGLTKTWSWFVEESQSEPI